MNRIFKANLPLILLSTLILVVLVGVYLVSSQKKPDTNNNNNNNQDVAPYYLTSQKGVPLTVDKPLNKNAVSCPIDIAGSVTGSWYFEANFRIDVVDKDNKVLDFGIATAQGDWMTTSPVEFLSTIKCEKNCANAAKIVFIKENASGLPASDDKVTLDIKPNQSCKP